MQEKITRNCTSFFRNRSLLVDLFAIFFGIGTWIGVNGTFIQLPLMVKVAPEGWNLPSYLSVMVQCGNLGPLAYTIIQKYSKRKMNDTYLIYGLLAIGTISPLLTAFFFSKTAYIFGEEHSLALYFLTFLIAINACTSNVLFMPYMGRFKETYLVTFFVGEGLSGLLPSVASLIQGDGGKTECILTNITAEGEKIYEKYTPPPLFGSKEFFIFIFASMLLSCIGFTLLDRLSISRKEYAAMNVSFGCDYSYDKEGSKTSSDTDNAVEKQSADNDRVTKTVLTESQYWLLLILIGIISFFSNGMFSSIQSYSCLPYGDETYHLTSAINVVANPIACISFIFLPTSSVRAILSLVSITGFFTIYVFVTAIMSPTPWLAGTTAGSVLVITVWALLIAFISYTKLAITTVMRAQGGKSLVWTGGLTQIGSSIGSVLIFVLINVTKSFTSAETKC